MLTTKQILKAIGCPYLSLYRADEGYFYFVYKKDNIWMDLSVYVYRLNHLSLEQWVAEGKSLVDEMEEE